MHSKRATQTKDVKVALTNRFECLTISNTLTHTHAQTRTHTHCHTHGVTKLWSLATCLALVPLVSPQSMRKSPGKNCRHCVYVTRYPDSLCTRIYPQYISTRLCVCKSVCVSLFHIANNSRRNNRQRKHLTTNWKPTPHRAAARARVGSMRANDETSLKQQQQQQQQQVATTVADDKCNKWQENENATTTEQQL